MGAARMLLRSQATLQHLRAPALAGQRLAATSCFWVACQPAAVPGARPEDAWLCSHNLQAMTLTT
jgi:hypothetical protein